MQSLDTVITDCHVRAKMPFPGRMPNAAGEKVNLFKTLYKLKDGNFNPLENHYIIDVSGSVPHFNRDYSPCLTRTRCGTGGFWLSWKQRKMLLEEMTALQGVSLSQLPRGVVTDRQLALLAGNAVPVPLLREVMKNLFQAAGIQ